jgi:hypothetical protein
MFDLPKDALGRPYIPDKPALTALTLRDQFAMAALTGILAKGAPNKGWKESDMANLTYRLADAMLVAREKK